MLNSAEYIDTFVKIQRHCMAATKIVADHAKPGVSEQKLADVYHTELAHHGITEFWYPTLICAAEYSGQPLTRRNHLPSADVTLRENDIVILDATPLQETVWGNWTITKNIGTDIFYDKLCADILTVVTATIAEVLGGQYSSLGEIYSHAMKKAQQLGLESIDPRGNVGHSIFQVPPGQTVDKTPMEQRLFIDATNHPIPDQALISLEPELARVNPLDGKRYGGKFQFVIPYGYGERGAQLIHDQREFYINMFRAVKSMAEALNPLETLRVKTHH
jgi:Metallopeptidase family M24